MLWVAAAFAAGIAGGWRALAAAPAVWLARDRAARMNLLLLIFAASLGAARSAVDQIVPAGGIAHWVGGPPRPVVLRGLLLGEPEFSEQGRGSRGWLRAESIRAGPKWVPCSGKLQVRLPAEAGPLLSGERLELYGLVRAPRPSADPQRFDEKRWLWLRGAAGVLSVPGPEGVTRLGRDGALQFRYRRWVDRFRRTLQGIGRSLLEPRDAGFLEALLLGESRGIPRAEWDLFKKTGTVHVLVVSGLHIGLIGGICLLLLTAFRFSRMACSLLLAGILATYCLLTGMRPPIVRATVCGLLLCWVRARGMGHSPVNGIGVSAALLLAADPRALADVSFQLSFAAVLAVVAADGAAGRFRKVFWGPAVRAAACSTAAWLATLPILAVHFRGVSFLAPAANLVIVPWASGLVVCGFLVYAAGGLAPSAAAPFAAAFGWAGRALVRLAGWLAALPGSYGSW